LFRIIYGREGSEFAVSLAEEFEDYPLDNERRRGNGRRPRATTSRSLFAALTWLDIAPRWHEGRVVWPMAENGGWRPARAELGQSERALDKLAARGGAASDEWLTTRRAKLTAAKRLLLLEAPDLPALAKASHARNPKHAQRLTELLLAEALCRDELPTSPAVALTAFGVLPVEPLSELAGDMQTPHTVRALAALVLGALDKRQQESSGAGFQPPLPAVAHDERLARAYNWGQRYGVPTTPVLTPALLVQLLEAHDGTRYAMACLETLRAVDGADELITPPLLKGWLDGGVSPARWPELICSIEPLRAIMERLHRRPELPFSHRKTRHKQATELRRHRTRLCDALAEQLQRYWLATPQTDIPALVAAHARAMLGLGEWHPALGEAIARSLRLGQSLPPALQRPWLELLVQRHRYLWNIEASENVEAETLERCWTRNIQPLHTVLKRCEDPALALEMQDLGLPAAVARHEWRDIELWRWLVMLTRDMSLYNAGWDFIRFCRYLSKFPNVQQARAAYGPIYDALAAQPPALRKWTLLALVDYLPERRIDIELVPAIARYAPRLAEYGAQDMEHANDEPYLHPMAGAIVNLVRRSGGNCDQHIDWLFRYIRREAKSEDSLRQLYDLPKIAGIAWVVAESAQGGEGTTEAVGRSHADMFAHVVRLALRLPEFPTLENRSAGLELLRTLPVIGKALYLLFERQPLRCLRLINDLGAANKLEREVLNPLKPLQATADELAEAERHNPQWEAIVQRTPELHQPALLYQFALRLGGEEAGIPAVLARKLHIGERLQRELAHLEKHPERESGHIATRIANLRQRLGPSGELEAKAALQASEKLWHLAGEALVAATEQRLQQCYRQRLERVIGPLPASLQWTADFTNAVLMSFDIESNRRLLRRLLRAYIDGNPNWPQQHPVNLEYLQKLGGQGIAVEVWQSRFPWRFPCTSAAGKLVRLHLEQDPLRILQMGNHFGTCLSRGDINAFSAVTNAVELNKRVVYALDAAGTVVGRQLIGINEEGHLVGFHVYTSLSNEEGNKELRGHFRRYIERFAARCGLALANQGTVPKLFARDWYDDGTVDWDDMESVQDSKGKTSAGLTPTSNRDG